VNKTFKFLFLAFVLILIPQINTFGCECSDEPNYDEMFNESNAVIKGEVVIVENFNMEIFALIRVEKSWKGIEEDKVIVKTDPGSCGVEFEVGKTYYLWVDKLDKSYVTMPCRDYGEKQISFLQEKPTLILKSSNSDLNANLEIQNENNNSDSNVDSNSNKFEIKKKSSNESADLTLIYAVSVTGAVILFLVLFVGFFFWRNRKR
jgi:hypothetical protein